ncbi:MAG: ribulose-phosphate 3-epimerase [Oscillospiraceae bacterium]|nr:ribulose-phosphate 3-epimerase [Oscillospiraceae bacterium]
MIKITPSILSADFARLGEEIDSVRSADYVHFDVMDGAFVPNISIGLPVLASVRKYTDMTIDAHLMIADPRFYARLFAEAGADIVTFHVEAASDADIRAAIDDIKSLGCRAGLSVKPKTPAEALFPYLPLLDLALVMTVEPGFGGQSFMPDMLPKITLLRQRADELSLPLEIEVDGGVNPETARLCVSAGADVLVAGSDVFRASDRAARIRELRGL